ncbi:Hypothetical protein F387_00488 [Wohlfahrtiimonas chitiniclastica SH04]|uniref:Uncharacterized protein n=1 Tax=Wohlfahrtiimonas chitiniclastica SH04 TaxID=1261130 RepID=L8XZR9_9GAMM|nr:Hypothetical protein F387_00488 [Wohlfahrtiimonas chitiniclastica SH04]
MGEIFTRFIDLFIRKGNELIGVKFGGTHAKLFHILMDCQKSGSRCLITIIYFISDNLYSQTPNEWRKL